MKNINWKTIILSAIIALITVWIFKPSSQSTQKESAYDRVIRTGTIRCGYFVWPPYFYKDPVTKKFSGGNYEIMEAIGKMLNLKIEWALEVGVGDVVTALNSDKFDVMCATVCSYIS